MIDLMPPKPEAFIFDWDNTLIDNWDAITDALNLVRSMNGLESWSVAQAKLRSSRSLRETFPEWFGDRWKEMRDIFYEHVNKVHIEKLRVKDGSRELLDWVASRGLPQFIVSTKKNSLLRSEVEYLGWSCYFDSVVGSLDCVKDKPNRIAVDFALSCTGIRTNNQCVWFVGDSQSDIECALNSCCVPVMVSNLDFGKKIGVKLNFSGCNALKTALNKWY